MESGVMLYLSAVALGALHAFEPGHGKSLIAAYMLGTRGRAVDGIILGLIVTFTHTFSVIILGVIAKVMAGSLTNDQLHTWLSLLSSMLILGVGLWMLKDRINENAHFHFFCANQADAPDICHPHAHCHDHQPDDHGDQEGQVNLWRLIVLGISGGMVPCPPAIAALLAAIGAGRIAQGLAVTMFFSLGLGLVMMTIGIMLSQAGNLSLKITENPGLGRKLGLISGGLITILGLILLINSIREIIL